MSAIVTEHYHFERIDGREVQKPLPKNLHAFIQDYLSFYFRRNLPAFLRAAPELNVLCGDDRLVPDVTVMRRDARFEDGDLADPPILAVEILSPGQTPKDLLDKADRLLRAGTSTCWIICPEDRRAWTYTKSDSRENALQVMLPGALCISVDLQEMWAELD